MKLYPYRTFTIETPYTREEVIERLNSLKRPKKRGFWNKIPEVVANYKKPKKRYYIVEFEENNFSIYIDYNVRGLGIITDFFRGDSEMGSSPRINGEIIENEKTTSIKFVVKPTYYRSILIQAFLFITIGVGAFVGVRGFLNGEIFIVKKLVYFLIPSSFPVVIFYYLASESVNGYYEKMKPFLTELLEVKG